MEDSPREAANGDFERDHEEPVEGGHKKKKSVKIADGKENSDHPNERHPKFGGAPSLRSSMVKPTSAHVSKSPSRGVSNSGKRSGSRKQ